MKGHFESRQQRYLVARSAIELLREPCARDLLGADEFGHVNVVDLVRHLRASFSFVTSAHLSEIVQKDAQSRFDLSGDLIRARTGHRYEVAIPFDPSPPPDLLYHGTCQGAAELILKTGIRKMGKAYVHLTDTVERADRVGRRKTDQPVILVVRASDAHNGGIRFWASGQRPSDGQIYLADEIPASFVSTQAPSGPRGRSPG